MERVEIEGKYDHISLHTFIKFSKTKKLFFLCTRGRGGLCYEVWKEGNSGGKKAKQQMSGQVSGLSICHKTGLSAVATFHISEMRLFTATYFSPLPKASASIPDTQCLPKEGRETELHSVETG